MCSCVRVRVCVCVCVRVCVCSFTLQQLRREMNFIGIILDPNSYAEDGHITSRQYALAMTGCTSKLTTHVTTATAIKRENHHQPVPPRYVTCTLTLRRTTWRPAPDHLQENLDLWLRDVAIGVKVSGYLMPGVATNTTRRTDIASSVVAHSTPVAETTREGEGLGEGLRGGEREGGEKEGVNTWDRYKRVCVGGSLRNYWPTIYWRPSSWCEEPPGGAFPPRATLVCPILRSEHLKEEKITRLQWAAPPVSRVLFGRASTAKHPLRSLETVRRKETKRRGLEQSIRDLRGRVVPGCFFSTQRCLSTARCRCLPTMGADLPTSLWSCAALTPRHAKLALDSLGPGSSRFDSVRFLVLRSVVKTPGTASAYCVLCVPLCVWGEGGSEGGGGC